MEANKRQIGGDHYKSEYQHWDWVIRSGMGYLEGVATKYLARWKKASKPKDDLQKCVHYIDKLIENMTAVSRIRPPPGWVRQESTRFCNVNNIHGRERQALMLISGWDTETDLHVARAIVSNLLAELVKPVPASDSNKHADRRSGANGMKEGDRVVYLPTQEHGLAGEFLQDGDVAVTFDDGSHNTVKWIQLVKER